MTDTTFGLEHTERFVQVFKTLNDVEWLEFLNRLKTHEALKIASATTEEARMQVHFRTLLIDELSNFSKSLFES